MRKTSKLDYMWASFDAYTDLSAKIGNLTLPGAVRAALMKTRNILENLLLVDGVL